MEINEYQELAGRTANNKGTLNDRLLNCALGLGEAGEVQNIIKKGIFHGHGVDGAEVIDELGDILWYISRMAYELGYTLEDVATMNVDKLKARYPEGFSEEKSLTRTI